MKNLQPSSHQADKSFLGAAIATFTPDRISVGPRAAKCEETPGFIVGTPHSGNLRRQILTAHGQAHAVGQRGAPGRLDGGESRNAVARIAALDQSELDAAADQNLSRSQMKKPANANGLGHWRAYADRLTPLIEELDHASSLNGWRNDEPVPTREAGNSRVSFAAYAEKA
jgi:hypothetical protein